MVRHLDIGDARYARAAERILRLHDNFDAEANITSAVAGFPDSDGAGTGG